MNAPTSNVVRLFYTKREVLEAWGRFRRLAIQVHEDPPLLDDAAFMAALNEAQAEWERMFRAMERC
jgi:hypothetical protein